MAFHGMAWHGIAFGTEFGQTGWDKLFIERRI
jgi:hypothetical protein